MNRFRLVAVLFGALCALGLMATSAFANTALPDVSALAYPLHLNGASKTTTKTKLTSANGGVLEGEGVTLLLMLTSLGALGTYLTDFSKVIFPKTTKKCSTAGDAAGTVLISGEWHIVLGPGGSPTLMFILFLVPLTKITCESGNELFVLGSVLGTANGLPALEVEETTSIKGALLQSANGVQQFKKYFNETGGTPEAKLESNLNGGLFAPAAENVEEELTLLALNSGMFKVTNR